jgi:glutathione S-transferase
VFARLYAIPASNAVLAAQLGLERKGIPYRRIDQLPVLHRITMRMRGFDGTTVPGLIVDGRKIHGSRAILRALDELGPEPRLALLWWEDLRPVLEGRPAANHAMALAPRSPGQIPPVFPRDALPA